MTSPQSSPASAPQICVGRPKILWLHTQPEHYFNCMMDDLQAVGEFDFTAAFAFKGPQVYKDYPLPKRVRSILLSPRNESNSPPSFWARYHRSWESELQPDGFDLAIVSGYAGRTQRQVMRSFHARGIPVLMWSDSNIRSQRGRSLKIRVKRRLKRIFLRYVSGNTDVMLTMNSRGIAYWRYFGVQRERIIRCPCYTDYARIQEARTIPRSDALHELCLRANARYLFTAARLVPAKGLDQMIRAFRNGRLAERGYHYFIAGVGPLEAELKALAGEDLDKSIHFLGFQQPQQNLLFIRHADVFVLPSVYEPHGIVIAEAAAAGTPVLASNACGAGYDLIIPGVTGEFYRCGDVEQLQSKLLNLTSDPMKLMAMRTAARRKFEEWFKATSPIKVVHEVARKLLRGRKPVRLPHGVA